MEKCAAESCKTPAGFRVVITLLKASPHFDPETVFLCAEHMEDSGPLLARRLRAKRDNSHEQARILELRRELAALESELHQELLLQAQSRREVLPPAVGKKLNAKKPKGASEKRPGRISQWKKALGLD